MSRITLVVVAAMVLAGAANAPGQGTVKVKEEKPGLLKQAKVTSETAMQTALRVVPGGRISEAELEREDGKLIYSFDIKVAGKSGIEEVNVDAMTGKVLAHEHESPAKEKAEERSEHKTPKKRN